MLESNHTRRATFAVIIKEKELWFLVLIGMFYFYRPLFLDETLFFRDLYLNQLPQKHLLVNFIKSGELPLWNPYFQGGQSYWAYHFPLYPSNLLYFVLPLLKAFNVDIILHFILCPVSLYILCRILGFQRAPSLIAAIVYGFCGMTLSFGNLPGRLFAMVHLPLIFAFWHLFLSEKKRRWFILTVIFGGIQVLAGAPETNVLTLLTLLGWTLFYPYSNFGIRQKFGFWVLLSLFIIGIASIQILPTLEMMLSSPRGEGLNFVSSTRWSLYPKRLPEILVPGFFGYLDTLSPDIYYWGGSLTEEKTPFILSVYCGLIPVLLSCLGGLDGKKMNGPLPSRLRLGLLGLFIGSILLSLGRFLPFAHIIFQHAPFSSFRYPAKFLIAGVLPLALLTGYTAQMYFGAGKDRIFSRKLQLLFWGLCGGMLSFSLLFITSDSFATSFEKFWFESSGNEVMRHGLKMSFLQVSMFLLLCALLYHSQRRSKREWRQWFLAGMVLVDFLSAGTRINPSNAADILTDIPPSVPLVQKHIGDGRLFTRGSEGSPVVLRAPSNDIIWFYRWNLEVLGDNLGAFYNFPVIFHGGMDALVQKRLLVFRDIVDSRSPEQRLPLLSAGAVTAIITPEKLSFPGVRFIAEIPHLGTIPFYLYTNERAAGRVEFVTEWSFVASDDEALRRMQTSGFDPRVHTVLHKDDAIPSSQDVITATQPGQGARAESCRKNARLVTTETSIHSAAFSVSTSCEGYLVFSEPFYSGWQVKVNGESVPLLRANYAFSAIFLPPGEHHIVRQYRSRMVMLGLGGSVLFLGILVFIAFREFGPIR